MAVTQVQGPPPVGVDPGHNLTSALWRRAERDGDALILHHRVGDRWVGVSWAQLGERVRATAAGLIALGLAPGERVALMSATRLEWTIADLAVLSAGGVTVPIYDTSSAHQCAWILSDSGARVAIVDTADAAKRIDEAWAGAGGAAHGGPAGECFVIDDGGLERLAARAGQAERDLVGARAVAADLDDLATIVYTSGTTGNPKGCLITHGNLVWTMHQVRSCLHRLLGADDSTLLFLPLAHLYGRFIQFACLENDVPMGYARSIESLVADIASFRPTFLLAVPRVFEKVFNAAQHKAAGRKAKIFDFAVRTSRAWSDSARPGAGLRCRHAVADVLVYAKLRKALGGRVRYCLSGGAPLAPHLGAFFSAAGITILEGYGLTETAAPATVNTPDRQRLGTVGPPLPGIHIKIAEDGEILIAGRSLFAGYQRNDAATAAALTADGWLRTGDVGTLDDDGFLRVIGRKKELIITAGGKNVAPAPLEERVKEHRLVSHAMVVGDNRPYVGCLVTLEPDELAAFAAERGLKGTPPVLAATEAVRAEVAKAVDHANAAVSRAESIKRWRVLPRDFTQEDGEVTPSLKLRRNVVSEHFARDIEALYSR